MPPKRKRADDTTDEPAASTRSTRSSARQSAGSNKEEATSSSKPAPAKKAASKAASKSETAPAPKKAKTSTTTTKSSTTTKKPAAKKSKKIVEISSDDGENSFADDEPVQSKSAPTTTKPRPSSSTTPPVAQKKPQAAAAAKSQPTAASSQTKVEAYGADRAATLFNKYADEDEPNTIGPEGFEKLCTDAQIPLEGAGPLILAWQLNAKEMAKIAREEWTKGCESLRISSLPQLCLFLTDLENLLVHGKPVAKGNKKDKDPYDKTVFTKYAADPKTGFASLYSFCFGLAKTEQSRNIEMDTSTAFWSVLLVPKYPIMEEVLAFISEKGTYKATNKDLWSMMLEFCLTVDPSLKDYEADGAWPTLLDDFVAWKKEGKAANGNGDVEMA